MALKDTESLIVEVDTAAESLPDPTTVTNRTHLISNTGAAGAVISSVGATPFTENGINVATITVARGRFKFLASDGTRWQVMDIVVGGVTPENNFDFWGSGTGTTAPDGTNDKTEAVARVGNVGVGGTGNPTLVESTLQSFGSIAGGLNVLIVPGGSAPGTLITDAWYVQANAAGHIQLPAGTPDGRMITIYFGGTTGTLTVNGPAGQVFTIGNTVGASSVVMPPLSQIQFFHNGSVWLGAFQSASPGRDFFAGTAVTDGSGNATFTFSPPFAVIPVVSTDILAAAGFRSTAITTLTTSTCVVNCQQSTGVTILGIGVLAAGAPAAGITVELIATVPGRTSS